MESYEELRAQENESNVLTEYWNQVSGFIAQYGWYLFGLGLLLLYTRPYIEDLLDRIQRSKEQKAFEAKCKKDSNYTESQQQAFEKARNKMQEEHDKKAAAYVAKMKEKEEKREELLSQETSGHRLGDGTDTKTKKKTWRPEYNPLMGSGGVGYRPPRRSGCSGGGCG